ncbi:MAG TPA: FixH family protein [Candidatus Methylomirabilis sp.]|nr:FixH family protein [Candidatus Methylomirabilis sp.]
MSVLKKIVALVVVLLAGAWAYHANVSSGKPSMDMNMRISSGSIPFPVTLASVDRGRITGTVTYTGSVAPLNEEDVYPRVTGRIVEMTVYPGDRVEKGQVVSRLDDLELTSRVQEAEAMATTALANRSQMEADVAAARFGIAQMEKELAVAEAESGYQQSVAARDERLFSRGAISQQEAENSRSMAVAAQAKVQAARARLEQAKAMEASALRRLEAADAMVAQGQAQAKTAQVVRDYVNIRATTSGYVVKRLVAPGVLVQPGTPVLKIAQMDKVRLQANVGEKDIASIRVGSPVTVSTTANDQPALNARVTSVSPFVDQGSRTAVVEAVVDNAGRRFLPGQYVQMQFTTGERADALTVPTGAVSRLGGKATVWVLTGEDQVEPREVTTGGENPERVAILKGLGEGERIVTRGLEGLYAGARVSVVAAAAPAGQTVTDANQGMPGMGGAPAAKVAQAGGGAAPAEKLSITLASNPVKLTSGNARLRIEVKDASGAPVSDAKVEVSAGMPGMDVPKTAARAAKDAGVYEATLKLGMAGAWTVQVTAARPQGGTTTAKLNLEAK